MSGGLGHAMPLMLPGGSLQHPAAQRAGLVALQQSDSEQELSAAEQEPEEESFWG